ncbi:alpha-1,6-mannosyltransferase [Kitasatospora sp. MAP12-15]|uniref:polyprenol phosphomannose-dependent alpha 1,6 mannosyltransferase MptB n=1 Tax=unclassified Kitasatospora TaxID=2633591 RepID=UPI0024734B35|nr:polyprenol phosphomannose-dependent alpha 1,6 mannosyltransferase MptB [Kitasatospora sp. MAP12-44]MDH6113912.1 alpha-1,6-mannosyltransferase [Kitasatospora sp. MAP12-44]
MPNPGLGLTADAQHCRRLGLAGSAALAVGGLASGAGPVGVPPYLAELGLFLAYFGMVLLVAGWLLLGLVIGAAPGRRPATGPGERWLLHTLACWAAPLLLGPPLFSRDVYSYLAQGALVQARVDVYTHGPAALGGPLADQVPGVWQHTPAPYGPVFLAVASATERLFGPGLHTGVFGLRLVAVVSTGVLVVLLPALARACGVDPAAALWLGALNPLLLFHLLAGAHNDALLLALLVGGLLAALGGHPVPAGLLVTLAALVKLPAVLGLPVVLLLWSGQLHGRARLLRAALGTGAVASLTTVAVTLLTGTGYGWIHALTVPVSAGSWSLTGALGWAVGRVLAIWLPGLAPMAVAAARWLGLAAAAVVLAVLAIRIRNQHLGAVYALGLGLAAVVALGPAIRPWYALWAVVLIAAAAPEGPVRSWAPVVSGLLALVVVPDGFTPDREQLAIALAGGAAALAVLCSLRLLGAPIKEYRSGW